MQQLLTRQFAADLIELSAPFRFEDLENSVLAEGWVQRSSLVVDHSYGFKIAAIKAREISNTSLGA